MCSAPVPGQVELGPRERKCTDGGNPAEDVGVEREVMFRDVQATLDQDLALECATVVWWSESVLDVATRRGEEARTLDEVVVVGDVFEDGVEVGVAFAARDGVPGAELADDVVKVAEEVDGAEHGLAVAKLGDRMASLALCLERVSAERRADLSLQWRDHDRVPELGRGGRERDAGQSERACDAAGGR